MSANNSGTASDADRGPSVFAVATSTLCLASLFVAARVYTRLRMVRQFSWDDYLIVLSWCLALALTFTIDYGTRKGLGRHDIDIAPDDWNVLRRCEYVFSILYNPALMTFKSSILVFYLRLSRNTQTVLRVASWAVLAIVNLAGAVLTLLNIFQCRPVQAAFDRYPYEAQCIPLLTEFICSAPINIVTDLSILALPLPVLTGMRLPRRQKIILVFTFTLGVFVTIVDVVRIYYLQQAITQVSPVVSSNPEATFGDQAEFAWNASLSLMWSAVEVNVGITCACVPTLKPLIVRILPAMLVDPDGTRRSPVTSEKQTSDDSGHADELRVPALGTVPEEGIAPPSATYSGNHSDNDHQVSAMEFLTTPDMTAAAPPSPTSIRRTATMRTSATADNSVYFGFVNMRRPKSLIRTSVADAFKYCSVVTILFFLWGFSYGLLNTLNNVIASVAAMSFAETLGLTSMYFGAGYFFGPLVVGEWVLRHDEHRRTKKNSDGSPSVGGFKATFIVGLSIYGIGTIMFWPSAVLTSFAGFMISNFVVGFGLSVLETAANPFLALCGPMDYAEMRLCAAQGVQAVATVISNVLAQKVFFVSLSTNDSTDSLTLLDVQWTYLAITLSCVVLALFFYYMPLPEVTDREMENSTRYLPVDPQKKSFGGLQLRTWTLILAILAQWANVAGQETMSIYFGDLIAPRRSESQGAGGNGQDVDQGQVLSLSVSDYLLLAHTAFAVSRFLTAYLAYLSPTHPRVPQPRTVLSISTGLCIVFAILVAALRPGNPNLLVVPIVLFYFAEGPLFPLIYTLGLRGQGDRTKRAAAYITMGACGPAFWPFVIYAVTIRGGSYQTAFALVPALFVVTALFSLFLDLKRDARALVDARVGAEEQSRIQAADEQDIDLDRIIAERARRNSGATASDHGTGIARRFSSALAKGLGQHRKGSDPGSVEHQEDKRAGDG